MNEEDFEEVAPFEDFSEGVPANVQLGTGEQVCVIRIGDVAFAISEECPHGEFTMSDGAMVDDYIIECGMHGGQFDVRDGSAVELPPEERIQTYAVRIIDGVIWIRKQWT